MALFAQGIWLQWMYNFQCLNFHPIFIAFEYWMIQVLGYFAHSASHTIFNQPITPTLSVHSEQPDPAGEAFSNLQSSLTPRFMGSLSALSIAHTWSYVSIFTLANINIKTSHLLYYDLLPFSKATPNSRCRSAKKLKLALGLCPGSCQVQYAKRQRQGFIFGSSKWAWQDWSFYRFDG